MVDFSRNTLKNRYVKLDRNFHDENAWIIDAKASRLEWFKECKAEGLADGRSLERQEAIARAIATTAKSRNLPKLDVVKAICMFFGFLWKRLKKLLIRCGNHACQTNRKSYVERFLVISIAFLLDKRNMRLKDHSSESLK